MTPAPGNPCFRHEPEDASRYDAVRSKPILTNPNGHGDDAKAVVAERSIAGDSTSDTVSKQQPVCGRIERSLLPLKKRATSHDSGDHSSADDSFVISPKKRRLDSGRDGALMAYGIPVQSQYDTVTVCATAASPKPSSFNAITTVVTSQQPLPLKQKKLVHVGIRSRGATPWHALVACNGYMEQAETSAAGAAQAKKKTNRNRNRNDRQKRPGRGAVRLGPRTPLRLSEKLTQHLEEVLGATKPRFVCTKTLQKSDVDKNQNRLLFSCKREFVEDHPITALFAHNDKETYFVNETEPGLHVCAFDRHGEEHVIRLKYLGSNGGYRLITGWHGFVEKNELSGPVKGGRRVDVELWAFRSPRLPPQPVMTKDEEGQEVVDGLEDHPDGALGLLFIPYVVDGEDRGNVHRAEEELEPAPPPPPPVHETKRQASAKKAVREEKKLADHVRANRGKAVAAREMTIDEVITRAGQELADSLIGLLMLSSCRSTVPVLTLNTTHRSGSTTM